MTASTPGHAGALPSHFAAMSLNGPSGPSGVRPSAQMNTAGFSTLDNTGPCLPSRETGGPSSNGNASFYLGYELKREKPKKGQEPTWANAYRSRLPWSSAELELMVKKQRKKQKNSAPEIYGRLKPNIKGQVDKLLADQKIEDGNVNFEWTLAALNTKRMAEGSIDVILERQFRRPIVTVASASSPVTCSQNQLNFSLPGQQGASRNAPAPLNVPYGQRPMNADNFAQKAPVNNGPITNMGQDRGHSFMAPPPPPPPPPAPMNPLHGQQQQSQQFRPTMPSQQKPAMESTSPVIEVFPGFDTQQHSRVPPPPPQPRMPPQQHQGPSSSFPPTTLPNFGQNPISGIPSAGPTTRSDQMPPGGPNSLHSPLAAPSKHQQPQQPQPQHRPEQFNPEGSRFGQQQDPRGCPPPSPPPEFMQQQRLGPKDFPTGKNSQGYSAEPLPKMRDFKSGKGDGEIGWPQGNSKLREHQFDVDDDDDGDDDDEIILTDSSADEESIFTSSSRSSDRTSDLPGSGDFHRSMSPGKFSKRRMPGSPGNRVHREHRKQTSSDMFGPLPDLDQRPRRNSFVESDRDDHRRPKRDRVSRREGRYSRRKSPAEDDHGGRRHRHRDLIAYTAGSTRRRSERRPEKYPERGYYEEDGVPSYVTPSRRDDWILDPRYNRSIDAGSPYSSDLYPDEEIPVVDLRGRRARHKPFAYEERESPRLRQLPGRRRGFEDIPATSQACHSTTRNYLPWAHEDSQMQRRMSLHDRDYPIDYLYDTRRGQPRRR